MLHETLSSFASRNKNKVKIRKRKALLIKMRTFVIIKTLSSIHRMYNLYTKFVKILEICKQFSENLVNESGNVPRRGPVPKSSDLEVWRYP